MSFCYFAFFRNPADEAARLVERDLGQVVDLVGAVAGLRQVLIHTPAPADTAHPFARDEPSPPLALQLYAERIDVLEQALRPGSPLQALGPRGDVAGLRGAKLQQQVMLVRRFDVVEPAADPGARACSYLVHYPGHAENFNAWLGHYLEHHPQIMRTFARIRAIEIYTRVDWIGGLPGMRVEFMQRNKLVFDSPSDLSAALLSPVIKTMRADYHSFPEFAGGNVHYPMLTRSIRPRDQAG